MARRRGDTCTPVIRHALCSPYFSLFFGTAIFYFPRKRESRLGLLSLKRAQIHTLGELLKYSKENLLEFKNFGQKSANEVCENLHERFNLTLN